jgi:ABC-2 type transport system permease protein
MKHSVLKIKRYLFIWLYQLKAALMQRMAYRFNFILMCISVFGQMLLSLVFIKVIFSFINKLAGWKFEEVLLIVASYMLIEGLMWATCAYLTGIVNNVRTGNIDFILVKPVDSQYLASTWRGDPEDWMRVITALLIFVYAFNKLNIHPLNLIYYSFFIICAYIIMYGINLLVKSLSFWTIEGRGLWSIVDTATKMSQYPTDIYFHKITRIIMSTAIPLAFVATIPAKALIYGPTWQMVLEALILAVIFFVLSRKFFHYALRHYSSASS